MRNLRRIVEWLIININPYVYGSGSVHASNPVNCQIAAARLAIIIFEPNCDEREAGNGSLVHSDSLALHSAPIFLLN